MKNFIKATMAGVSGFAVGLASLTGVLFLLKEDGKVQAVAEEEIVPMLEASSGLKEISINNLNNESEAFQAFNLDNNTETPLIIPFKVDKVFEEIVSLDPNDSNSPNLYVNHYINETEKSAMIVSVTDAQIENMDLGLKKIQEDNERSIQYSENSKYQFIYINKDNLYYEIKFKKNYNDDNEKFTIDELLETANSIGNENNNK